MALSIYCSSVTVFFILMKLANYRLHLMFDEGEAVVHNSLSDLSKAPEKKSNASDSCLPASIRYILTDTRKILKVPICRCTGDQSGIQYMHSIKWLLPCQDVHYKM